MSISSRHKKNKRSALPAKVLALLKPSMENVVTDPQITDSTDAITETAIEAEDSLILPSEDIFICSDDDKENYFC